MQGTTGMCEVCHIVNKDKSSPIFTVRVGRVQEVPILWFFLHQVAPLEECNTEVSHNIGERQKNFEFPSGHEAFGTWNFVSQF